MWTDGKTYIQNFLLEEEEEEEEKDRHPDRVMDRYRHRET